ncbi:MAG TPA: hypothetical protein P5186_18265 [Candidatus Paceibacterota bacterium]|nr:hypothetical protein [Verrucomicrobiota bacterium]HRY50000.1 hypothetical protein [Candidatus Paceibacterota bacterium]HRZ57661.1 hypothetical protein [Candidatus Paceibacterota bacterium]
MGELWAALGEGLRQMGATELASLGGLAAAVGGILLALLQVRLLRRQLKLDALIKIMDSNREIVAMGFEYPVLWSALDDETATVFAEEARARRRYLQLWINHVQVIWEAWRLGLVAGAEWEAYRSDITELLRVPALREHWEKAARFYPRGFQRLVARLSPPVSRG